MKKKTATLCYIAHGAIALLLFLESCKGKKQELFFDLSGTSKSVIYLDTIDNRWQDISVHFTDLRNGLQSTSTFGHDGNRITGFQKRENKSLSKLVLFGCSYIEGSWVNDSNTAAFLLQNKYDSMEVVNAGRSGRGTVDAFIELQRISEKSSGLVKYAIYNYASFHEERNVENISWKLRLSPVLFRLRVRCNGNIIADSVRAVDKLRFCNYESGKFEWYYVPVHHPGPVVSFFSKRLANIEWRWKENFAHETTKRILYDMQEYCRKRGICFVTVLFTTDENSTDIRMFCDSLKIKNYPMGIDLNSRDYTFLPKDPHPNIAGHKFIAERIATIINGL